MKKKNRLLRLSFLIAFLAFFGLGQNAWAATVTWTGATDNDWNTAGNWSPAALPTTADDVVIPTGATITTSGAVDAKTISISGNSTLTITQATNIATAATGGITLNGTSVVTLNAAVAVAIGSTIYRGDIVMNDNSVLTFATAAATLTLSGTWLKGVDATITSTVPPNYNFVGTTALSLPSTVITAASIIVSKVGSTVTLNGAMTNAGTLAINNGTLIVGNYAFSNSAAAVDIDAGATLDASATTATTRAIAAVTNLDGTLNLSGTTTNTLSGVITMNATGVLNISNSTTTLSAVPTFVAGCAINAEGATFTYTSTALDMTSSGLTTNSNTNLSLTTGAGSITLPSSVTTLHSLTINKAAVANAIILSADLTIAQNLTITVGTLSATNRTIVVNGAFSKGVVANAILSVPGATLTFNGSANFGASDAGLVTDAATNITFNGIGAVTFFPGATRDLLDFTYNKPGVSTTLTAHVITFAATSEVNITSGTILLAIDDQLTNADNTVVTTIGANGTIDFVTFDNTFLGTVTGTGTLDADQVTTTGLVFSGPYSFTGNFITAATTYLTFDTDNSDVELNSSIVNIGEITFNRAGDKLTINSDLTFGLAIGATEFVAGEIDFNGHTVTFGVTYTDAGAAVTLTASNSSLIFVGIATFTAAATYTIDETTNLEFRAAPVLSAGVIECNNLTIVGATAFVLAAATDFEVWGNLDIQAAGGSVNLLTNTQDLTVHGDVSNAGTMVLTGQTLTLYGLLEGEGAYTTTSAATSIEIEGTSSQLIFPATFGASDITNLTINRPSGAKLNRNLTLGAAGVTGLLTITDGDLDLNGYVLTLAATNQAATLISETAGNTVINTGASVTGSNGYIAQAASTALVDITASGIGISSMVGPTVVTVERYPMTVAIPSVGLATSRIFRITNDANITAVTFQFDNTELYSSASDLEVYTSTVESYATNVNISELSGVTSTVTENTPSTGFGRLALSGLAANLGAATRLYALGAVPGDGGVMRIAMNSGNWGDAGTWSPSGVPSKVDQAVIGPATVTLNGNGVTYEAKTLNLNHANATLQPANNTINGDKVNLRVMGNITLTAGAEILGVNGTGRLSLVIGDGVTTGVSSTITVNNDYVTTSGIWVQDFTVNTADVTGSANQMRISGDVALIANSAVSLPKVEFWGGYDASQVITVPTSANLSMATVTLANSASVATTSDFTLTNHFLIKSGSTFNATGGTATFTTAVAGAGDPWNVENGGALKLYNVEFNSALGQTFAPLGTAYIQGNFWQYNTDAFAPTSGRVIFSNTSQKEIVNTSNADDLDFFAIEIAPSSKVVTSNSWRVASEIDVKVNAELKADNGTITMVGTAPLYIKNASTQTLEFNNLTISTTTYTSDSWTIKGDLVTTASLIADNGTITFENIQENYITANALTPPTTFFKLLVADGSKLTTNTTHNFTIKNNATNPTGAGIEVVGTGEFYVGNAGSVITFDADAGVAAGYPKTITNSSTGRLEFGLITIAASPNNEVSTTSDFEITGTGAAIFNNAGAGGKFTATAGTVTFTGDAPVIVSVSPAVSQFYSIRTESITDVTLTDAQEIYIAGDLTTDGQSTFAPVGTNSKVIFNGGTSQTIGGTSSALTPVAFADVVINKANDSELLLAINTTINSNAAHELTLTNGILNLGSKTLTNGAGIISRTNGLINGSTGTYIIATNHQNNKLEDVYFTIGGTPTLYNLTVNAAHTTANTLTVNGTLNLNTADLTIGDGASVSAPVKLICNGDVTRTSAEIAGSVTLSRLVLQGTGTVSSGLSNTYFNGAAATTVQLEIARGEVLGGNLNIAATSYLRLNSGINDFDLGTNTLTFTAGSFLTMISGGINAGTGSTVNLTTAIATIPASMFRDNEVYNLTIGGNITLAGDLRINGTMTGVFDVTTNDNTLTFGPTSTMPVFTNIACVFGNLRRYVTNTATSFPVGNGTANDYLPVTLQFANAGSSQAVKVSRTYLDPVIGRGGSATNSVDVLWTITPEGTAPTDSIKAIFSWPSALDGGATPAIDASFPAKWNGLSWTDYRTRLNTFTPATPRVLTMNGFAVQNSAALEGDWAIFNATANTTSAKDAAIAVDGNRIVITNIDPTPVVMNNAFKVTIQLQDQFNQPIVLAQPYAFTLSRSQGAGTFTTFNGVIPAGESMVTVSGLSITASAGGNHQLKVDTTGGSAYWTPTVSDLFDVLPVTPATQASAITFTNVGATSMTISWTQNAGPNAIVLVKPEALLLDNEFPVNGTTYYANTIVGAGSNIGGATTVYNGSGTTVDVTGLAPNTTYYVYVFNYSGTTGANENYRTTAAAGNPKAQATSGSYNDDLTYGVNNTRTLSKTIGTNTPLKGTMLSASDEDWFNFTVTNVSPNVRAQIYNIPGNYTLEVYDMSGRRIRRSTLNSTSTEAAVINDLPSGTYTVRIFSADGSFWTRTGEEYTLKVSTFGNEIYAVTP